MVRYNCFRNHSPRADVDKFFVKNHPSKLPNNCADCCYGCKSERVANSCMNFFFSDQIFIERFKLLGIWLQPANGMTIRAKRGNLCFAKMFMTSLESCTVFKI